MGNQRSQLKREELEQLAAASHYSQRELQQLYKQFQDEAPSGIISRRDFNKLAEAMAITDPFLTDLVFNSFDLNKDGAIEFSEFILAMSCMTRGTPDEKLEFAFSLYDLDNDGYITREEMLSIVRCLGKMLGDLVTAQGDSYDSPEALVDRLFSSMDINRDGKLSLEEYKLGALRDPCIVQGLGLFSE